jgi:hypothetical protein
MIQRQACDLHFQAHHHDQQMFMVQQQGVSKHVMKKGIKTFKSNL